jgi:hypothetical protein
MSPTIRAGVKLCPAIQAAVNAASSSWARDFQGVLVAQAINWRERYLICLPKGRRSRA